MKLHTIKKGNHSSGLHFSPVWRPQKVEGVFMFTESCLYELFDNHNEEDWNKLVGISMRINPLTWNGMYLVADWPQHIDSGMFVWRRTKDTPAGCIEIGCYSHVDGEFDYEYINVVSINSKIKFTIHRHFNLKEWMFKIKSKDTGTFNVKHLMSKQGKVPNLLGYHLFPYFGGQETAPQNIDIGLEIF